MIKLIYFQGNLKGNFSVRVFNAVVAILIGSKPDERKKKLKYIKIKLKLTIIIIW
jgi:hypothetical protein